MSVVTTYTMFSLPIVSSMSSDSSTTPRFDAPQLKDEILRNRIIAAHSTNYLHWQVASPQPSHGFENSRLRTSVTRFQVHTLPDVQICLGHHVDKIVSFITQLIKLLTAF